MYTQTHIYVHIYNNLPRAEFGKQGSEWALQKSKAHLWGNRNLVSMWQRAETKSGSAFTLETCTGLSTGKNSGLCIIRFIHLGPNFGACSRALGGTGAGLQRGTGTEMQQGAGTGMQRNAATGVSRTSGTPNSEGDLSGIYFFDMANRNVSSVVELAS